MRHTLFFLRDIWTEPEDILQHHVSNTARYLDVWWISIVNTCIRAQSNSMLIDSRSSACKTQSFKIPSVYLRRNYLRIWRLETIAEQNKKKVISPVGILLFTLLVVQRHQSAINTGEVEGRVVHICDCIYSYICIYIYVQEALHVKQSLLQNIRTNFMKLSSIRRYKLTLHLLRWRIWPAT
jgi:hypothetical protein